MSRRALVTGITGQDGSYLAEHLLSLGYEVFGLVRGQANLRLPWLAEVIPHVRIVRGDLLDQTSLIAAVELTQPDEVYNLGAMSFVPLSWEQAEITADTSGMGVLRMLEAIRIVSGISGSRSPAGGQIKFYQASTSEMFGKVHETPQSESTPFHPRSPYGVAKTYAHFLTQNYRESYGMFAVSGILFNHESPRRGPEFVSRKITLGAARVKLGLADSLMLGNLEARRDWGYAAEYVQAMHLMLQQPDPVDLVVGTGTTYSVRDFAEKAFAVLGLDWRDHVELDGALNRPAEVAVLRADPTLAADRLGWTAKVDLDELVRLMVEADVELLSHAPHFTRSDLDRQRSGLGAPWR